MQPRSWPFSRARVLLPVIHLPLGEAGAFAAIDVAIEADADGVFLINQGMRAHAVLQLLGAVKRRYRGLWVGVNLLGYPPEAVPTLPEARLMDGIWADDAGVDRLEPELANESAEAWRAARVRGEFPGLYFGGTAFKTQDDIPDHMLPWVARAAASFVDVVTTSGRATGVAARVDKVRALRETLGDHKLAVASGVSPDNVAGILPYVDAYLVATGIERTFGVLDPARTKALAEMIHAN
ncbi:MAG: hypothetical protein H6713_28365 [Myxococcales bacterium]|nr:hypothetical protein [Myxococcales bacterium]MCB9753875.1 hypothetical protein [Myxococcales bacterium]